MTTETEIKQLLSNNPPAGKFTPYSFLSRGVLTVYFAGDPDYSEPLTDWVTLYRSIETRAIVGCRIDGAGTVIADMPLYTQANTLRAVLWSFRGGLSEEQRRGLNELAALAGEFAFDLQPTPQPPP